MKEFSLPLRALVLAPRPDDLAPASARAHVEAFYDALEAQGDQMELDWLWPATWEALRARFAAPEAPAYAVVLADLALGERAGEPTVVLENAAGAAEEIGAAMLGALLGQAALPLLILRPAALLATATATTAPRLAAALAAAGVSTLVVQPSLSVASAGQAFTELAAALLAGKSPSHATAEALRRLSGHEYARVAPRRTEPPLALYAAAEEAPLLESEPGPGAGKIIAFPGPELAPPWQRLAAQPEMGGLPTESEGGFWGRGRELTALERALRGERAGIFWLHGAEGLGKTTLAAHAARWLVRTGSFAQVVYLSLVAGSAEMALDTLGQRLLGEAFSLSQGDAVAAVEAALVQTPTLVLWDDLEAVLPEGDFPLPAEALSALLSLGERLAQAGASRLLVLSESASIPHPAFTPTRLAHEMTLAPLDETDAQAFLTARLGASSEAERAEMLSACGGHPLALRVLAGLVAERGWATVGADLESLLPGLRLGEARLRNQVLEVVLQELLRTFDEDAQARMLGLSLYAGVALSPFVPNVVAMEPAAWAACQKRLGAAGVLSEERLEALTVPLLRVTLAWGRHLARRLVSPQRGAVETSYANSYVGLAGWLLQNETQNPQAVRVVARCEWPNLCRTLELLLAQDRLNLAHTFMQHLGHFCEGFGWVAVRDALSARVEAAAAQAIPAEGPLGRTGVQFLLGQGEQLLALGQVNEAGSLLQQLSERIGQEQGLAYSGDEAQFDQGLVAHQLGRCMRAGGRPDLALEAYERAHSFLGELLTDESVQRARLALSEDLGETLVATGQIDGAEVIYQQALSLAEGLGERGTLGALHEHLALIAIARQDAPRAATLLRDAITHFAAAEDLAHQASAWHHLGTVLWQQSEAAAAEQAFQQSLTLAQRTADAPLQAQLCLQLGQLAESAKRVRDAETYYARAQATCQQHGVPAALVAVEMAWAGLLLREGQLANARVHADAAYSALEQAGPGAARPWDVYTLLARIAEEEGDVPRAATWRARAQDAFAASSEAARVLAEWRAGIRGVARACRGETLEGDTVTMLETLDRDPSWQRLIAVIWRILDGERGAALYADLDYVDAAVARRILSEIEHPQWASDDEEVAAAEPTGEAQETSFSLEQLFTAVEAALRGDEQARQIVGAALQQMSQPDAPEPLPRLAQALLRIIQGERGAELAAGLPEELSAALETLLLRLT